MPTAAFIKNAEQAGLSHVQFMGLAYMAGCIPTVLAHVNQDKSIIDKLKDVVRDFGAAHVKIAGADKYGSALMIFRQLYFKASLTLEEKINTPVLPPELVELTQANRVDLFAAAKNNFNVFSETAHQTEYYKLLTGHHLIENIGNILQKEGCELGEALSLGHAHANFWINDQNGLSFCSSVIGSNVLPTYLASIINSIPLPDELTSKPDIWLFSKELNWRLHETVLDNFDEPTKRWIWNLHNFLFYTNNIETPTLKDEFNNTDGLNNILSQVFLNIGHYNNLAPLTSVYFRFYNHYQTEKEWTTFINTIDSRMEEYFGIDKPPKFNNLGELYSFFSYRFIAAITLYFD